MPATKPAIEGWFTVDDEPHLIGRRCGQCGTYVFPPRDGWCPNPTCDAEELEEVALSRTGRVWSYTDARYQPPEPYVAADPFEPFALAAVELTEEQMVILGQVADGFTVADLEVGTEVELVTEPLFEDDEGVHLTWRWRPVGS